MPSKSLIFLLSSALLLTACASKKAPDKHMRPVTPKEAEVLYKSFLRTWDFNRSGEVTCDDITLRRTALFYRIDKNHDGELVESEYRFAKFEDKNFFFFPLTKLDKNASASVNLPEFLAVSDSQFQHFDRDKNCTVSKTEAVQVLSELGIGVKRRSPKGSDHSRRRGH